MRRIDRFDLALIAAAGPLAARALAGLRPRALGVAVFVPFRFLGGGLIDRLRDPLIGVLVLQLPELGR